MVNQLIVACIPAFNEEQNLASVVTKVSKFADKIIVCDDGSTDMTREIAVKLGCDLVVHSRRLGKGVALKDLFEKALDLEGDIIVTIDGDGQNNPDDIPALINPIFQGEVDIVVGSRFLDKSNDIPFHRVIGNNVFTSFTRLLSSENFKDLSDSQSGFRAYSRKVLEFVKIQTKGMGVDSEIIISASDSSFKITEIPISVTYNGNDGSTFNPIHHSLNVFYSLIKIASEQKPLLYFGLLGFILIVGGLLMGLRVLTIFFESGGIATGSAIISVGLIVIGFLAANTAIVLQVISNMKNRQ